MAIDPQNNKIDTSEEEDVDKKFLYGQFELGEARQQHVMGWRDKLTRKLAYKSLDIADDPEDEMGDIDASRTIINEGTKSPNPLLALGLLGTAATSAFLLGRDQVPQTPPVPLPPIVRITRDGVVDTDTVNIPRLEFAEPIDD